MGLILTLPRLGETMEEARVTDWLKAPGDSFRRGEVLLEVETDKTVVEVPAMQDGVLIAQLVAPGQMVALDAPIAEVETTGAALPTAKIKTDNDTRASPPPRAEAVAPGITKTGTGIAASPRARALARQAGVALDGLTGTGRRGRITGADVPLGGLSVRRLPGVRTPVLMLHGLHDNGLGWRDLPDRLAALGHAVVVPDLPGHGGSDPAAGLDAMATALQRAVPEGPVRLCGHSLGAVIAARMALALGNRVEALVLLAPVGLGPRINADFLDLMAGAQTTAALGRALVMLGAGPMSDLALRQELDRIQRQRPATVALARELAANGIQQVNIAPDLARLTCPVTAVFGLDDRIIDWRDCASLPATVAIHLVPGAGHLPQVHAPGLVAALIAGTGGDAGRRD